MAALTIWKDGEPSSLEVDPGTLLSDALIAAGAAPDMPCGGNGKCGKCRVRARGALSPQDGAERALLGGAGGMRLACFARVLGDAEVWCGDGGVEALSWAEMPSVSPDGSGYGIAADVGTTTVAVRLYDLATGAALAEALEGNRQAPFGADVITRIGRAESGDAAALTASVRGQLAQMAQKCMAQAGVASISRAVVTGNTTMLHFYEGLDASGIARAPFTPASRFGCESRAPLLGAPVWLPPCVGAYIGADTVCAILASGMTERPELSLLADIGTNGEVALRRGERLLCCSTAAGPAFEGAGLSMGMRAARGALTGVSIPPEGGVRINVLGGGDAAGICGSGAIDAARVMRALGVMDESGRIDPDYAGPGEILELDGQPARRVPGTEVCVTQKDVRQIQLAKSAVCAGIRTLLLTADCAAEDVKTFDVAGGFGRFMDARSAARIGLFPEALLPAVRVVGNGALAGASMALLSRACARRAEEIRDTAEELELSGSAAFMDFYVDGMFFGEDE